MNVLLFNPAKQQEDGRFDHEFLSLMRSISVALCQTLDELYDQLRSRDDRPHVVVLFVLDRPMLKALVETRDLLVDLSLILVLPNQSKGLLTLAHKLRPRFIDFSGIGSEGLVSVLKKMTQSHLEPS